MKKQKLNAANKVQRSVQESSIVHRLETLIDLAGPQFVHELIEVFLQIGRKDFDTMKKALNSSSPEKFLAAAQSLKATSLNMGASELSGFCKIAGSSKTFASKIKSQEALENIEIHLLKAEDFLRGYIKETHSSAS